jgi:hypothetical protein
MRREMKRLAIWFWLPASFFAGTLMFAADASAAKNPTPILVELFTSEGCSSCPPADVLLQQLDVTQPISGAQLIVLSEHVTYWDQLGWKDPYSSSVVTDRQAAFASHFGLASSYTPEMVVDGTTEFVGNDSHLVTQAIQKASSSGKVAMHISSISGDTSGKLRAYVEADALPASVKGSSADIYLVLALDHAESQVERGENKGHHLAYVAVVQSITKIGTDDKSHNFAKQVEIKIDPRTDPSNVRVIAFLQRGSGPVLGAAMGMLTTAATQRTSQ